MYLQAIDEELSQVEPVFEKLVDMVQSLLDTSEPSEDREVLEQKLDDVKIRWYCLREKTPEREEQILKVLPLARKYDNTADPFAAWLEEAERRVGELEPIALNKAQVSQQAEEVKTLKDDVIGHREQLTNVENVVDGLVKMASADQYIVEAQAKDLAERYESLVVNLGNRERRVDAVKGAVKEYQDGLEVVECVRDEAVELAEVRVLMASPVEKMNDELKEVKVGRRYSLVGVISNIQTRAEGEWLYI